MTTDGRHGPTRHRHGRVSSQTTSPQTADLHLLTREGGEESWRALRILAEFVDGFEAMRTLPPAITVFGSARTPSDDPMYAAARAVGAALAEAGFAVITGGGAGSWRQPTVGATRPVACPSAATSSSRSSSA